MHIQNDEKRNDLGDLVVRTADDQTYSRLSRHSSGPLRESHGKRELTEDEVAAEAKNHLEHEVFGIADAPS